MIDVCCALIFWNSSLLAVQRGEGKNHPYQWEFPGGKVEKDETYEECIVREIMEELEINIQPQKQLSPVEHVYPNKSVRLIPFICCVDNPDIKMTEHIQYKWLTESEMKKPDWQEADRELIEINYNEILNCMMGKNYKEG